MKLSKSALSKPLLLSLSIAVIVATFWRNPVEAQVVSSTPATAPEPPPAPVEVATASQQLIAPAQWVPGTVVSRADARIGAELGGRLLEVVEVGSVVKAGATLARLDTAALQIERRQDRADVERLRTRHEHAQRQVQRLEAMGSRSAVAEAQLDDSRMQRDVLAQELARAQADLADSERRIKASSIRAPFDGTVVERLAQSGEVVSGGTPLLRLVDTQSLEIQARAPAQAALNLSPGGALQVRAGQQQIETQLRTVVPVGDGNGSRQLELRVALQDSNWPVGSAVEVAVPQTTPHSGVTVPRDALVQRGEQTFVFRIAADGKAQRLEVQTGAGLGSLVEIAAGISAGDVLVIRGGERLREGQTVTVVERG